MAIARTLLAFATALVGMLLAAPIVALGLPFWVVATLTRAVTRLLEPRFLPWYELIVYDPAIGWKLRANINAHGIADEVFHFTTDSQGWRGPTQLAESQVVVFGDSYAFGYGVDDEALFSEVDPQVRIKGIGAPGYNMVQELLLMRQLSPQLTGKLVVWFIYVGNDLYDNLMPDMKNYRTPFVRSRNGLDTWEIVTKHVSPARWSYASGRRDYLTLLAQLCTPNFLSERVYAACKFLIKEGSELCQQQGAQLVVMTIPDSKQLSPAGVRYLAARAPGAQTIDPGFPDEKIREICDELSVPFVAGKDHLGVQDYKERDIHWNERGNQQVARLLARLYHDYRSGELGRAYLNTPAVPLQGPRVMVDGWGVNAKNASTHL